MHPASCIFFPVSQGSITHSKESAINLLQDTSTYRHLQTLTIGQCLTFGQCLTGRRGYAPQIQRAHRNLIGVRISVMSPDDVAIQTHHITECCFPESIKRSFRLASSGTLLKSRLVTSKRFDCLTASSSFISIMEHVHGVTHPVDSPHLFTARLLCLRRSAPLY